MTQPDDPPPEAPTVDTPRPWTSHAAPLTYWPPGAPAPAPWAAWQEQESLRRRRTAAEARRTEILARWPGRHPITDPCPRTELHTPTPTTWNAYLAYAHRHAATHTVVACPGCGCGRIWLPHGAQLLQPEPAPPDAS